MCLLAFAESDTGSFVWVHDWASLVRWVFHKSSCGSKSHHSCHITYKGQTSLELVICRDVQEGLWEFELRLTLNLFSHTKISSTRNCSRGPAERGWTNRAGNRFILSLCLIPNNCKVINPFRDERRRDTSRRC